MITLPSDPTAGSSNDSTPGMTSVLNLLIRNVGLTLLLPLAVAVGLFGYKLFAARQYRSDAAFVPARTERVPSFAGIAAQLGVTMPSDDLDQSPAFYADLIRSREVLGPVVEQPIGSEGATERLIDIYEIDASSAEETRQLAVERLRKSMRVRQDPETGVVTFSVAATRPVDAKAVAEAILRQVNTFNSERRRGSAQAERAFVEDQLRKATAELAAAEQQLKEFDERNMQIARSPGLMLQRDRLLRQLNDRQEVVSMLNQAFVRARIDEVKNTPTITMVERASFPIKPEPRGSIALAVSGFVIASFLGLMLALVLEFVGRLRKGAGAEQHEFRRLVARFTSIRV